MDWLVNAFGAYSMMGFIDAFFLSVGTKTLAGLVALCVVVVFWFFVGRSLLMKVFSLALISSLITFGFVQQQYKLTALDLERLTASDRLDTDVLRHVTDIKKEKSTDAVTYLTIKEAIDRRNELELKGREEIMASAKANAGKSGNPIIKERKKFLGLFFDAD